MWSADDVGRFNAALQATRQALERSSGRPEAPHLSGRI
jgi:hypothetical protein